MKEMFFIDSPGNSVSEVGERMKGGAVKEDKSPENEAILINMQGDGGGWSSAGADRGTSRKSFERTISGRKSRIRADSLARPVRAEGRHESRDMNKRVIPGLVDEHSRRRPVRWK